MDLPKIDINFHDSVIIKAEYDGRNQLELNIQLYEIYYSEKPIVKVSVNGIFNLVKVEKLYKELIADEALEIDWLGWRIESLHYDRKIKSSENDVYLFVAVDNFKPIRIHCKKVSFTYVE